MRGFPSAGKGLSNSQIQAEIGTFIMAGYETTAHTLSFTLYNIAAYAHVQKQVTQELQATGLLLSTGQVGRELLFEDLRDLPYLNSVLKESMRMFPVVAAFPR